jgi:autotransporter-associated beta strand protein
LSIPQGGSIGGNITNNGRLVIEADLVNPVAGTGALVKTTIGNAVLWSSNSYTGATEVEAGQLRLDGAGAISPASTVYVASGASFSATGDFLLTNNLSISGLTGEGEFYSANGTLTVNKASGTNTFSGRIAGNTGLTKSGDGTFVLSGSNSYTGPTAINAGRVVVANGSALGSTSGGTVVAGDAQLRLNATNTGFAIGAEALTVSGQGLIGSAGGALRNAAGANTYQGKITLAADAGIGAASGTLLILDVASGDAIDLASFNLTIDGAGFTQVNDGIAGTGGIAKIGSGTITLAGNNTYTGATTVDLGALVVSNPSLSATISPTSVSVDFASPPVTGSTYTVLSGALATNSFVSTPVVNGLGSGQTATVTNNPNLVVLVSGSPASNNYASWLANYPSLTGADTNGSADPDGDGFINNTEFAFDGNPTVGTPALMTATAVGTNAVFNWIERTNGVTYEVQKNSSLTNAWTSTGIIGVVASNQSGVLLPPEYVRKQFSTNASGKDFYRVRATIP